MAHFRDLPAPGDIPEKPVERAHRVAATVSEKLLNDHSRLYPGLQDIRELSIGNYFYENNLATLHPEPEDKEMFIRQQVYNYEYEPSMNDLYSWPEKDARHGFPVPVLPREMFIRQQIYDYEYEPSITDVYDWPEKDAHLGYPVPELPRMSDDE
ncbi:hypothetical protein OSTOST_12655 [Ostertagia ostertagi]